MKKLALTALFLMLLCGSAVAHNGALMLFTDRTVQFCDKDIPAYVQDTIMLFYMRDAGPDLGYGVEFKLQSSTEDAAFLGAEWNSQINNTLGDIESGISLVSATCMGGNESVVYIGSIFVMYVGADEGSMFTAMVVANPTSEPPGIYILGCEPGLPRYSVLGGTFVFNCPPPGGCCSPGVKETSWGAIKELYR